MNQTESKINIYQKLSEIQAELNVPKNQYNNFGGYNYRNAEDILSAAKPILKVHGCIVILSDDIVSIEGKNYVKATATLVDAGSSNETVSYIKVDAFAREPISKKGMDESQITGASSSYARKYALAGLFAIDDGNDNDNDALDKRGRNEPSKSQAKAQKSNTSRINFAEVRAKLSTINTIKELNSYWRELNLSDTQSKYLTKDFSKRKEELNGK